MNLNIPEPPRFRLHVDGRWAMPGNPGTWIVHGDGWESVLDADVHGEDWSEAVLVALPEPIEIDEAAERGLTRARWRQASAYSTGQVHVPGWGWATPVHAEDVATDLFAAARHAAGANSCAPTSPVAPERGAPDWSEHGYWIGVGPEPDESEWPDTRARCCGPPLCGDCARDAEAARREPRSAGGGPLTT